MNCWCITNDKAKTEAIADAEESVRNLISKIERLTALSAQTTVELAAAEKEKAEDIRTLEEATALRQKQLTEFNSAEKDMLQSISSLTSAVTILSKTSGKASSMIQTQATQQVQATVQNIMENHAVLLSGAITHSERSAVESFLQAAGKHPSAAAGGEIFGILSQMKETFETNLANTQKEEETNQKNYDELKAAKEHEIQEGTNMIDEKTKLLADTDESNSQAAQDLENTQTTLASDQEFLASLKEKCALNTKEWTERSATRVEEMAAVEKARAVLDSDDAKDLASRSLGFLQTESSTLSARRAQASKVIAAAAAKTQNRAMASLSVSVRINAFTKVKEAIDDMAKALGKQKADDITTRDYCIEQFEQNELKVEARKRTLKDEITEIKVLERDMKAQDAANKKLKAEIADLNKQLKIQGEDRNKQNKEFQLVVTDQRATQKLLKSAKSALEGFYNKAALLQQEHEGPVVGGFKKNEKNNASTGVMKILQQIINDSKALEAEATRAEQEGQAAYETFIQKTNDSITTKLAGIQEHTQIRETDVERDIVDIRDKKSLDVELEQLGTQAADLHKSCDFITKNFELRQTGYAEEIDAMQQAKGVLSGGDATFLQRH